MNRFVYLVERHAEGNEASETLRSGSGEPVEMETARELGKEVVSKHPVADTVREAL